MTDRTLENTSFNQKYKSFTNVRIYRNNPNVYKLCSPLEMKR